MLAFYKKIKELRYLPYGLIMSIADLVPGVSGATIAVLLGFYGRLIRFIHRLPKIFLYLKNHGVKYALVRLDYKFVLFLLLGLGTGILAFSRVMHFLISNYEVYLFSFFSGLVLFGAWIFLATHFIAKSTRGLIFSVISLTIGAGLGFGFTFFDMQLEKSSLTLFISGFFALSAMIMPGISGSYVLLILGTYHDLLFAISHFMLGDLFIFACGGVIGLLLFANLMYYLMKILGSYFFVFIAGLIFTSSVKILPIHSLMSSHDWGLQLAIVLLFILGCGALFLLQKLGGKHD